MREERRVGGERHDFVDVLYVRNLFIRKTIGGLFSIKQQFVLIPMQVSHHGFERTFDSVHFKWRVISLQCPTPPPSPHTTSPFPMLLQTCLPEGTIKRKS
jgi:hypothetical protein